MKKIGPFSTVYPQVGSESPKGTSAIEPSAATEVVKSQLISDEWEKEFPAIADCFVTALLDDVMSR